MDISDCVLRVVDCLRDNNHASLRRGSARASYDYTCYIYPNLSHSDTQTNNY